MTGTVVFEQDSESAPTKISWDITGHDPNAKRGFHSEFVYKSPPFFRTAFAAA